MFTTSERPGPSRREFVAFGLGAFVVAAFPLVERRRGRVVRRTMPVMGTIATFAVVHRDEREAHAAIDAAMTHYRKTRHDISRCHGLCAALANALGCEELDDVRSLFLPLAHELTKRVGPAAPLRERVERRQQPRSGNLAARDRGAERFVLRRTEALRGRDSIQERDVRVPGDGQRALEFRLAVVAAAVVATLRVEVPGEVVVCVDQAGKQRERREVVDAGTCRNGGVRSDGDDAVSADDDGRVRNRPPGPVEHPCCPDDGDRLLGDCFGADSEAERSENEEAA